MFCKALIRAKRSCARDIALCVLYGDGKLIGNGFKHTNVAIGKSVYMFTFNIQKPDDHFC